MHGQAYSYNDGRLSYISSMFVHNDVFEWMNYCRDLKYFKVYTVYILGCKYLPYFIKLNFQTKYKILLYQIMNKQNKMKRNPFKQQLHCLLNLFICSVSANRTTFVVQWPKNVNGKRREPNVPPFVGISILLWFRCDSWFNMLGPLISRMERNVNEMSMMFQ